jgi:hypothetical protein
MCNAAERSGTGFPKIKVAATSMTQESALPKERGVFRNQARHDREMKAAEYEDNSLEYLL